MKFILVWFFPLIFFTACDRFEAEDSELGRIVIGESVDGVNLGADTSFVFEKLGTPSTIYRISGSVRYRWELGPHAGIEIYYNVMNNGTLTPYSSISITHPYEGQTEDGIGIGTSRKKIIQTFGEPTDNFVDENGMLHEQYYIPGSNIIRFVFSDEALRVIFMAGRSERPGY